MERCTNHCAIATKRCAPWPSEELPTKQGMLRVRALRCCLLYRLPGLRQVKFLRKIHILRQVAACSNVEFHRAAISLASPSATIPLALSWAKVVDCHYDLNTCLRESLVMLKCSLRTLSANQLGSFQMRSLRHDSLRRPLFSATDLAFLAKGIG